VSVKNDLDDLVECLKEQFPVSDLIKFNILKYVEDDEGKDTDEVVFKYSFIKKGGLLLVPSFDLYSNLVTGFRIRATHPEKWMIDAHMKEVQFTANEIINPLPFGMGYKMLKDAKEINVFEGHPDALASIEAGSKFPFLAIPGVNNVDQAHLGLLTGKKVNIYFDQDNAGQEGAKRLAEMLEAAGAGPRVKTWDSSMGGDVNEALINGNASKLFS
jgi:hypothetical protein